jgi:hypothetical protein
LKKKINEKRRKNRKVEKKREKGKVSKKKRREKHCGLPVLLGVEEQ